MPRIGLAGYAVIAATLLVNLFVVWYEGRQAKLLQSELLESDAAHTGSDVLATLLVLGSFIALRFGLGWADVAASVAIVVLIVRAGIKILQGTLSTLSDERRLDPHAVEVAAMEEPGVYEVHNVRSRGPDDDIVNLASGAGTLLEGNARTSPLAMNVTGNIPIVIKEKTAEAAKSLKCGECGSLNYPTEWYCERCGAELAAL
jgi:hypothetical protein